MRRAIMILTLSLVACNGPASGNDAAGPRVERSYPLTGFSRVVNAAPADVRVNTGGGFGVSAAGDAAVIEQLDIAVRGNVLHIGTRQKSWRRSGKAVTVTVNMPSIDAASISGAGEVTIDRGSGNFVGEVNGAGTMAIGRIDGGAVRLAISGAGDIAAAGSADRLDASVSGTGAIRARELTVRGANVDVAGAGSIEASVDGDASVSLAGIGSVDLGPRARCRTTKAGIGSVTCGR